MDPRLAVLGLALILVIAFVIRWNLCVGSNLYRRHSGDRPVHHRRLGADSAAVSGA
jgi:hypothetical protein